MELYNQRFIVGEIDRKKVDIRAWIKLNGKQLTHDRLLPLVVDLHRSFKTAYLDVFNKYLARLVTNETGADYDSYYVLDTCVPAPEDRMKLFQFSVNGDHTNVWDIEVAVKNEKTGEWDNNGGHNYRFRFPEHSLLFNDG